MLSFKFYGILQAADVIQIAMEIQQKPAALPSFNNLINLIIKK